MSFIMPATFFVVIALVSALSNSMPSFTDNSTASSPSNERSTQVATELPFPLHATEESRLQTTHVTSEISANHAQESTDYFTDIASPYSPRSFDSPPEYGSVFDTFPSLPYFPDFGEIFRIQRTTTPEPPFHFPGYIRDAFPERPPETSASPSSGADEEFGRGSDAAGRHPSRRPPRPAPSGTKSKVAKQNQNEPKEKTKSGKGKPTKARDYPKIFRFTSDRVNLAEFDMKKKMDGNFLTLTKGDDLDPDKVERNKFLILHGGVFEIDGERMNVGRTYDVNNEPTHSGTQMYGYGTNPDREKPELQDFPYYYKN